MNKTNKFVRLASVIGVTSIMGIPLAFADATSTATTLGTASQSFLDTLVNVSLVFLLNNALITAGIIAMFVFGVLYWIKSKAHF